MKRLAYFLSYAYSVRESIENGNIDRLKKELEYWSKNFAVDVYSKDSKIYLNHLSKEMQINNVNFRGILFSVFVSGKLKHLTFILQKFVSVLMLTQYYFLLPLIAKRRLDKVCACLVQHVSGGMCAVIYKKFFNPKMRVMTRYNWNWGYFIKNCRGNLEYNLFSAFERYILRNSDVILTTTQRLKEEASQIINNKVEIKLVPNWIDCNIFKPRDIKKEFDILSVGRLCRQKNHLLLLEAIKRINKKNNKALKVLIIGQGELREALVAYTLEDKTDLTIIDRVSNNDMPEYFNKATLFVMPSRYEGHPKAMLEAMACGIPVIGTDVVGIKDVIKDSENGLLCKEDADDLASKIELLLNDSNYIGKMMSKVGIEYVKHSCSLEIVMNKIKEEIL